MSPEPSASADAPRAQRSRVRRLVLGGIIAAAFVAGVHGYIGWTALLRPWAELPAAVVIAPGALLLASHALRALRVHDYFGAPVRAQRRACLQLVLRHNLVNNLLPMRLGEVAFPVLMQRRFGIGLGHSVPGLLWFRALDLHSVVLVGLAALTAAGHGPLVAVATVVWLGLPPAFAWRAHRLGPAIIVRAPRALRALLERGLHGVPAQPRIFWRTWVWTLAIWAVKLSAFAWILCLFATLAAEIALLGAIGGELTSVLPVHGVAGLGTYEAGVVAGLAGSGAAPATLIGAAVNLHLFMLGLSIVAGAVAWLPLSTASGERQATHGARR